MPYAMLTSILLFTGFFRSLQFTCINAIGYADIPPARMSRATSLSSAAQQLSLSMGVALAAAILALIKPNHAAVGLAPSDFLLAFGAMACVCLASLPFFASLSAEAGQEVSRYRREGD